MLLTVTLDIGGVTDRDILVSHQVCVIFFGLSGAFALYAVCNSTLALGFLVDYNALFILSTDPAAVLLAPLVVVACMVPFVAVRFWRHNYRATASEIANIASVVARRDALGGVQEDAA